MTKKTIQEEGVGASQVSNKLADLIGQIESLKVAELAELVTLLEERFGVKAGAMVMPSSPPSLAGGEQIPPKEEKARVSLHLIETGPQKIAVIKAIREIKPDLGLKEAKDLVEAAPKEIVSDIPIKEAEEAKKKLEGVGAKVELR